VSLWWLELRSIPTPTRRKRLLRRRH